MKSLFAPRSLCGIVWVLLVVCLCGCSSHLRPRRAATNTAAPITPSRAEQQQLQTLEALYASLGTDDAELKALLQTKIKTAKAELVKRTTLRHQAELAEALQATTDPNDRKLHAALTQKIEAARNAGIVVVPATVPTPALHAADSQVPHLEMPRVSLNHTLTEAAYDGRFTVPPDDFPVKVDAQSVLHLNFPRVSSAEVTAKAGQPEDSATTMLRFIQKATDRFDEINSRQPKNEVERKQMQRDAAAAARTAADLFGELRQNKSVSLDQDELADIILGDHKLLANFSPADNGYVNLGRWLTVKMQQTRDELADLTTNQQVKVMVQAFRESNGSKSALHVEGWDTFAAGPYQPIDRTGLRPTPSEQERLDRQRQQAETQKRIYEAIVAKDSTLRQALKAKRDQMEQKLDSLAAKIRTAPAELKNINLQAVTNRLAELTVSTPSPAITNLLKEAVVFQSDLAHIQQLAEQVQSLIDLARNLKQAKPEELIFSGANLFAQSGQVVQEFTEIATVTLPALPGRVASIRTNLATLTDAVLQQQTQAAIESVGKFFGSLGPDFEPLAQEVVTLLQQINGTLNLLPLTASIHKPEGDWIPRSLDNLVPGRLDLSRSSIALGDIVSISVTASNEATGELLSPALYQTEIGLMGLHGKPEVHFILARAFSGPGTAKQWKPNVAAAVEWHYTIRNPAGWEKTWNWLYPGFGVHLANLDQGNDSVEFGAGPIVSLWDGLLTGGYGYNFSDNPEHQYVFVGINLLNLLDQGKKKFLRD
jgi:hypothetical protein